MQAQEQNDPEEEAQKAAEEGGSEVYDDNPDLGEDGTVTEEENEKFTDAAVALGDKLNNPQSQSEEKDTKDYFMCLEISKISIFPRG